LAGVSALSRATRKPPACPAAAFWQFYSATPVTDHTPGAPGATKSLGKPFEIEQECLTAAVSPVRERQVDGITVGSMRKPRASMGESTKPRRGFRQVEVEGGA
jgi:hypothetical protein